MKRAILIGIALCAVTWVASAATAVPAKKKSTKRRAQAPSAAKRTSAKATPGKTAAKARATASKTGKGKKVAQRSTRSHQLAPTKDRYQQIQQALASKGYFAGEANGQWGPDSTEALKRFQADQNLTPDGKLSALSLIALGLGPKRLSAQSASPSHADLPQ